jgi:diguanylate cyclase (GGDEF)-like protein
LKRREPHLPSRLDAGAESEHHLLLYGLPLSSDKSFAVVDGDGRILFLSPQLVDFLGTQQQTLQGTEIWPLIHVEDRARAWSDLQLAALERGAAVAVAVRAADAIQGQPRRDAQIATLAGRVAMEAAALAASGEPDRDPGGDRVGRDPLTGLLDRTAVTAKLAELLRASGPDVTVGVLVADLDHFGLITGSYGHRVGDRYLVEVARRLQELPFEGIVGRSGGDEFVLVSSGPDAETVVAGLSADLACALERPISAGGRTSRLTASVGVAHAVGGAAKPRPLLRDAELALRRAKELGSGQAENYSQRLRSTARSRLEIESRLDLAIDNQELRVHYQPVVSFDGEVLGVEALVRWQDPQRGLVPPADFVPIAEETGLIVHLDEWVLEHACEDVAEWRQGLAPELSLGVNLSAARLTRPGLEAMVAGVLNATGMERTALCLEVTETALLADTVAAAVALNGLRDLGVRIALDDFGIGYSSLLYLRRFPVQFIKLDRIFVLGLGRHSADDAIAGSVVDLAHVLGMHAIAEGVETAAQADILRRLGCDAAQGFLWSPALPANQMRKLLASPGGLRQSAGT